MRARVQARGLPGAANVDEGFVDKKPVIAADETLHIAEPSGPVDKALERFAHFKYIVQVVQVGALAMNPAAPRVWRHVHIGVHYAVQRGHVVAIQHLLQHQEAAQVEQIFLHLGRFHDFFSSCQFSCMTGAPAAGCQDAWAGFSRLLPQGWRAR